MKVTISVGGLWDSFDLAEELEKRGWLEKIITSYPRFRLRDREVPPARVISVWGAEIPYRISRFLPSRANHWGEFFKAVSFDALAQGQINHCDLFVGYAGFALRSLRKVRRDGAATILFRNNTHVRYQEKLLKEEFDRYGIKAIPVNPMLRERQLEEYEQAQYIRVPSEFARRTFLEAGFEPQKVMTIPHGIKLRNFPHVPKTDNMFRILYVGAIVLRKGIQYLLKAVKELNLPNSELLLLGGIGDDVKVVLKKYARCFKYGGIVPRWELFRYYSQGSVYVLPSLEEGMAFTVLEAMSCGLPVIASENSGVESLVHDGRDGFLIPIRDTRVLREKLLYLYENPMKADEMGASAERRVESFSLDRYGVRIAEAFTAISAPPRSSPSAV